MGKNKKNIPQRKRLAALFASFAIVIMGTASLLESMTIDYYTVLNTLEKVFPAAIALGTIGWVMGMVLDKPKKTRGIDYNSLFLKNLKNKIDDDDDLSISDEILGGTKDKKL